MFVSCLWHISISWTGWCVRWRSQHDWIYSRLLIDLFILLINISGWSIQIITISDSADDCAINGCLPAPTHRFTSSSTFAKSGIYNILKCGGILEISTIVWPLIPGQASPVSKDLVWKNADCLLLLLVEKMKCQVWHFIQILQNTKNTFQLY